MWYLRKEVVLTKDNLGRRNCHGDKRCVFCSCNETNQHLFFDCHFAKFVWRAVHITFGVVTLTSINHMYGDWLHGLNTRAKSLIMVGVAMLCWALWLSRNDIVFEKSYVGVAMLFCGARLPMVNNRPVVLTKPVLVKACLDIKVKPYGKQNLSLNDVFSHR
jgi:hypothetical protein